MQKAEQQRQISQYVWSWAIMALALVYGYYAYRLLERSSGQARDAAYVPVGLAAVLLVLGAGCLLQVVLKRARPAEGLGLKVALHSVVLYGLLLVYVFLLSHLGFLWVTPGFVIAVYCVAQGRKVWPLVAMAVGLPLGVWAIFTRVFSVSLP